MMKRLLTGPALAFALTPMTLAAGTADAAGAGSLDMTFEVGERTGAVMVALFDSESSYQKSTPVQATRVPVGAEPVKVVFPDLKPGRYAAKAFHDVNNDGAMNVNPFDMPTEPYGFSNNAQPRFGPAPWSQASFEVTTGKVAQTISLKRSGR